MSYTHTLGIDLHKRTSTWKLLDTNKKVIWSRVVLCSRVSIEEALTMLPVSLQGLPVALEPVCGWMWVTDILENKGLEVHIANPFDLRVIALSSQKTDSQDAETLAEFLAMKYLPESWKATKEIHELRQLTRTRDSLVKARTKVKNHLEGLITQDVEVMNKKTTYIPSTMPLHILEKMILEHTQHIKVFDGIIKKIAEENNVCKILMTIPKVGPVTAVTVLAEVGDFSRFKNAKRLSGYAGLVPRQRSSGEKISFGSLTKEGSSYLRTALVETAMRFRKSDDINLFTFLEEVQERKGKMKGRVALARKLLTVMYSLVKNETSFIVSSDSMKLGNLV